MSGLLALPALATEAPDSVSPVLERTSAQRAGGADNPTARGLTPGGGQ